MALQAAVTPPLKPAPSSPPVVPQNPIPIPIDRCKEPDRILFYSAHPLLDTRLGVGFSDSLSQELSQTVVENGYCLVEVKEYRTLLDTIRFGGNLVLHAIAEDGPSPGSGTFVATALKVRELAHGRLAEALARPLVSLRYSPGDAMGLPSLLAKKISENLRSQFVADLLIKSHPDGAAIRMESGMDGITPVEWVLPLGHFHVILEKPGYLPLRRDIDLSAPGMHAYDLQLAPKRFYHSKFIYPALILAAASFGSYALEQDHYSTYRALGPSDQKLRPQAFSEEFHTAQFYEKAAYTTLAFALVNLGLCFAF